MRSMRARLSTKKNQPKATCMTRRSFAYRAAASGTALRRAPLGDGCTHRINIEGGLPLLRLFANVILASGFGGWVRAVASPRPLRSAAFADGLRGAGRARGGCGPRRRGATAHERIAARARCRRVLEEMALPAS
eukprot:gene14531-biopygen17110